jgi:hypothetical protein
MGTGIQWDTLRRQLAALAESVAAEIRAYPAPITACDAQFNRLLELRRLIPQELQRLETAADDPAIGAADFLRSSPCAEDLVAMKDALDKYPTLSEASTTS